MKKALVAASLLVAFSLGLTACGAQAPSTTSSATSSAESSNMSSSATTQAAVSEDSTESTAIVVAIDGTDYPATLNSSQATQSLIQQLPLDASFRDFASGFDEKIADLSQPLDYGDETYNNDPSPLDIAYWSPDERLVFYYGDVGAYNGIHIIGHFDSDAALSAIENLSPDSQVSIRLAE